jgi:large subunit ribosomal protein L31e
MAADKLEREYIIPLRRGFLKVPRYKRSKKTISVIEEFLKKHMKADVVKIGKYLNEYVWQDGIKNPPSRVEVRAVRELKKLNEKHKNEVLIVTAELKSAPVQKETDKKSTKKADSKDLDKKEVSDTKVSDKKEAGKTNIAEKDSSKKDQPNKEVPDLVDQQTEATDSLKTEQKQPESKTADKTQKPKPEAKTESKPEIEQKTALKKK